MVVDPSLRKIFQFYRINEEQKVTLAAAYHNDMADSWYQGWTQAMGGESSWAEFSGELCD